jgi:hypothetical protein
MAKGIMVMKLGLSKLRMMSELCNDDEYSGVEEILSSQSYAAQGTEEISSPYEFFVGRVYAAF